MWGRGGGGGGGETESVRGEEREYYGDRRDKQSVFHFSAPVDRRNKPAKTCLLNTSLSLLSGCSLNGSVSRAAADEGREGVIGGRRRMNALRLLSDTVNDCYENAFMSVRPASAGLNIDVAHSLL